MIFDDDYLQICAALLALDPVERLDRGLREAIAFSASHKDQDLVLDAPDGGHWHGQAA